MLYPINRVIQQQNWNVIWRRDRASNGLNATSGAQFAALSLVNLRASSLLPTPFCFVLFWGWREGGGGLNMPNRPFRGILQLFAQGTGLLLEARLEVKLLSYKPSCSSSGYHVILMLIRPWTSQFTCEKQEGLYHNRQPPALLPSKGQGIELTTVSPPTNIRALANHNSSKQS